MIVLAINKLDTMNCNCEELIKLSVVQQVIQYPVENRQLFEKVFSCIDKLFREAFIQGIIKINPKYNIKKLTELAEEAFHEGLIIFLSKTKKMGLKQNAALGTIIFTYGLWQFMAIKKREFKNIVSFDEADLTSEYSITMGEVICKDEIYWDEALKILLHENEYHLHQAIRLAKKEWQKILYWYYFDQINPSAIAAEMKVSEGHIYNILTKARKELKIILQQKINF
jgi:hypothetical protein